MATIVVTLDTTDVESGVRRVRDELASLATIDAFEGVEIGAQRAGAALSDIVGDANQAGTSFNTLSNLAQSLAQSTDPLDDIQISAIGAQGVSNDIQNLIQFSQALITESDRLDDITIASTGAAATSAAINDVAQSSTNALVAVEPLDNISISATDTGASAAISDLIDASFDAQAATDPLDDIILDVDGGGAIGLLQDFSNSANNAADDASILSNQLDDTSASAGGLSQAFGVIRGILPALSFAAVATGVASLATAFDSAQRAVVVAVGNIDQASNVTARLSDIARAAGASISDTAGLFQRFSIATENLNLSQSRTIGLVETLTRGFALFSSSTAEAGSAAVQLAQGLATGALQGDELRSVLENFPPLAQAIARELGVTTGELRDLGAEGAITADIVVDAIDGLGDSLTELERIAGQTVPQAFGGLIVALQELIGGFDQASGASDAVVFVLNNLSQAIADVADVFRSSTDPVNDFFEIIGRNFVEGVRDATFGIIDLTAAANALDAVLIDGTRNVLNMAAEYVGMGDSITTAEEALINLTGEIARQQIEMQGATGGVGNYSEAVNNAANAINQGVGEFDDYNEALRNNEELTRSQIGAIADAELSTLEHTDAVENLGEALGATTTETTSNTTATRAAAIAQREAAAAAREEANERGELIDFIARGGIERAREQNAMEEATRRQVELFRQVAEANRQNAAIASEAIAGISEALGVSEESVENFGNNFVQVLNGIGVTSAETFNDFAGVVSRAMGVSEESVGGFFDVANDALDIFGIDLEDVFGRRATNVINQFGNLSSTTIDLILSAGGGLLDFFGFGVPQAVNTSGTAVGGLGTQSQGIFSTILGAGSGLLNFFGINLPGSIGTSGGAFSSLGGIASNIFGSIINGLGLVQGSVGATTGSVGGLGAALPGVGGAFAAVAATGIAGFQSLSQGVGSLEAILLTALNPAIAISEGVLNAFGISGIDVFNSLGISSDTFIAIATGGLSLLFTNASDIFGGIQSAGQFLWDQLSGAFSAFQNVVQSGLSAIQNFFSQVFGALQAIGQTVMNALSSAFNAFQSVFQSVFSVLQNVASSVFNAVQAIGSQALAAIRAAFSALQSAFQTVFNVLRSAAQAAFSALQSIAQSVINAIVSAFNTLRNVASQVFSAISSLASSAFNAIRSIATSVVNAIGSAFRSLTGIASSVFSGIANVARNAFNGLASAARAGVSSAISALGDLASKAADVGKKVGSFLGGVAGKIGGAIGGIAGKIGGVFGFAEGGVINGPTAVSGGGARNQRGTVLKTPSILGNAGNITPTASLGVAGEAGPEAILPLAKTSAGLGVRAVGAGGTRVINSTKVIVIRDVSRQELDDLMDQIDEIDASIEERSASQAASILLGAG